MATTGIKTANKQKLKLIEEGMEVTEESNEKVKVLSVSEKHLGIVYNDFNALRTLQKQVMQKV